MMRGLSAALGLLTLASCATNQPVSATPPTGTASPVEASKSEPAPLPAAPQPTKLNRDALVAARDACLEDRMCSREEVVRLMTEAADRGAIEDCAAFYYGVGVARDLGRARACFSREVANEPECSGSSPSLNQNILATMMSDGQGGPKDLVAARSVFQGCFEDVSVTWLKDPPAKPSGALDFCKDIGGTTLSMSACASQALELDALDRLLIRKDLAASVGRDGLIREEKAFKAFSTFASAAADVIADRNRGGTLMQIEVPAQLDSLHRERNEWLRVLATPMKRLDRRDKVKAMREHDQELAKALAGADAERQRLVREAEARFVAYRRAEVAFAIDPDTEARTTEVWTNVLRELKEP